MVPFKFSQPLLYTKSYNGHCRSLAEALDVSVFVCIYNDSHVFFVWTPVGSSQLHAQAAQKLSVLRQHKQQVDYSILVI